METGGTEQSVFEPTNCCASDGLTSSSIIVEYASFPFSIKLASLLIKAAPCVVVSFSSPPSMEGYISIKLQGSAGEAVAAKAAAWMSSSQSCSTG